MKPMMNNALEYNGIVKFKLKYKNDKEVELSKHNAGTNKLFEFFAKALYGINTSSLAPYQLDIKASNNVSILNNPIVILQENKTYGEVTIEDEASNVYAAIFKIFILKSVFRITPSVTSSYNLTLEDQNQTILATIQVSGNDLNKITDTVQGLVEWNMYVKN